MMHLKFWAGAGMILSLTSCIGSAILFEDDHPGEYGNLSSVPEESPEKTASSFFQEKKHLETQYDSISKHHQEIKQKYSLED